MRRLVSHFVLATYLLGASGLPVANHSAESHGCHESHGPHAHGASTQVDAGIPLDPGNHDSAPHDPVQCSICFALVTANTAVADASITISIVHPDANEHLVVADQTALRVERASPSGPRAPPALA